MVVKRRKVEAAPRRKKATSRRKAPRAAKAASPANRAAPVSAAPILFRLAVHVTDLDRAVSFYSRLLGVEGRLTGGARCYFDCGPVILAILDVSLGTERPQPIPTMYFSVENLEEIHAQAREMGCLSGEEVHGAAGGAIVKRPWGERSFYTEDPFGNSLCFVDSKTVFKG